MGAPSLLTATAPCQTQLWAAVISTIYIYRLVNRSTLSPAAYSRLGLACFVFVIVYQPATLLSGSACFASVARSGYQGSLPAQAAISVATLTIASLMVPVTQAYVPLKAGLGWIGFIIACYLTAMFDMEAGRVTLEADPDRWTFLAVFLAVSLASLVGFVNCIWRVEASMSRFLCTLGRGS